MKRFIHLFLIASAPVFVYGQQVATTAVPQTFSLEQCVQYALENSVTVKNAQLDQEIANERVKETVGIGLPQITGSSSLIYNQKLSRFFSQYSGPGGGIFDFSSVPGIQPGDVVAAQNFFQLKSSGDASVSVNQILFNGSYLVGLQAAKSYKDLSLKTSGQSRETLVSQVTKAYYLAVINNERITLFDANIARVDSLLRNTKALNTNGFAEQIDVDRVQVTYNNLITEREKFINLQEVAQELLKFQMNYPMDQTLAITGNIADFTAPVLSDIEPNVDFNNRWDYQLLQANKKLLELDLKNKHAGGVPSLSAFAKFGMATQSNTVGGLFSTGSDIKDQGGVGPDKWYDYSNYGISLNVPIFTGLQRNHQVQQAKLTLLKTENSTRQLESAINLEAKQTRLTLDNAIKTLASQKANMELASNVARVTKIKYEQGVGSSLEVIDAESSLRETQINYYNAMYDAMIAKVDIDKAYGKLVPVTK